MFSKINLLGWIFFNSFLHKNDFKKPSNRNKICHSLKKYLFPNSWLFHVFLCINIMLNVTFNGIWWNEIYLTCIQLVYTNLFSLMIKINFFFIKFICILLKMIASCPRGQRICFFSISRAICLLNDCLCLMSDQSLELSQTILICSLKYANL